MEACDLGRSGGQEVRIRRPEVALKLTDLRLVDSDWLLKVTSAMWGVAEGVS